MKTSRPKNPKIVPDSYDLDGFKPMSGFEELYLINKYGVIISLVRREPHFMRTFPNKHGYIVLTPTAANGSHKQKSLGFLLHSTFGPPRPSKWHRVYYKDGNRKNLSLDNLQWCGIDEITAITSKRNNLAGNTTKRKAKRQFVLLYPDGTVERVEGFNDLRDKRGICVYGCIDTRKPRRKDKLMVFTPTGWERFKQTNTQWYVDPKEFNEPLT